MQDNSLPPGLGTLGLAIVISNAEPFVASLLGFFQWRDCPPCINQLCYGRKAFLALQCPVSGSDSSSILLLLLSFTLWIHAESPAASRRWVLCPAQEMASWPSAPTSLKRPPSSGWQWCLACGSPRGRDCGLAPLHATAAIADVLVGAVSVTCDGCL